MTDAQAAANLRTAFDLFTAGVRLQRQNLRRRHPEASEQEIDRLLKAWMQERPGAEHGDAMGKVVPWPRRSSQAS